VSTEVGKGSTFKVYLPAHDQVGVASAAEAASKEDAQTGATIFVVEDEDSLRELACEIIRDAGYKVIAAGDGVEALKIWKEHRSKVDLLFTDIVMPNGISGRDLARQLRADRRDLKVSFTSGYSAELIGKDSLLAEGNSFLAKPYSPKALLDAVRQCLSGNNSQLAPASETAALAT
jgi:CheY-like chemotaxis protein